ncbi:MAG: MFS transporter [Chloroflexota bacterium]
MVKGTNQKIFYGYIIVAASTLILVVMHGLHSTYGIFFSSIQNELSSSRALISGASSLAFFLEGLFAVPLGRLTDKYGPRIVVTSCGIIFGLGYLFMSRMTSLWQLYIFYPVLVGVGTASGNVSLLSTVTRWFILRRGLATSIIKAGTGIGFFVMPLVASWLILGYGWRNAYVFLSIIAIVGVVAFAQFLRSDPARMGLQPYGTYNADGTAAKMIAGVQLSLQEAMRTRSFWILCAVYFVGWYATQSIMIHIVPYAIDSGITAGPAAGVLSIIGAVSIAGRLTSGGIVDRLGGRRALMVCFIILITALTFLQFTRGLWMLYAFAVVYGFAHGGLFTVMSPIVAELFGTKAHGTNFGMVLFLGQIGGAIGPVVTGRIFDVTGSYQLAFWISIVASTTTLLLGVLQIRPVPVKPRS